MDIGKIITKGIGIATIGLVCYDAHKLGQIQADKYASAKDVAATKHYINNAMYSGDMSTLKDKLKMKTLRLDLDWQGRRFFNEGKGYMRGFTDMLIHHVIPLGLGVLALVGKKTAGKIGAIGSCIVLGYEALKSALGWGVPKGL